MKQIIEGKLYSTKTAELIASDSYWDGNNFERHGRNQFLYKTKKGNFFLHNTTIWQGEHDSIEPITKNQAMYYYQLLPERKLEYEDVFNVQLEEA